MDIYHFTPDSAITKVEFTQDANRVWIARIFPQPGADPQKLTSLTSTLNQRKDGIITVPQSEKGVHSLYASGFSSPHTLLTTLKSLDYTKGQASVEHTTQEADAYTARIRAASLKLGGMFYLVSDAAMTAAGLTSKPRSANLSSAGVLYFLGGLVMSAYGRKDAHTHLKELSLKLGDFLTREGIEIPKDGAIMGANQERSPAFIEAIERFAYSYPSQIFNTFVAACGVKLMQSGMVEKARKGGGMKKDGFEIAAGALVLGGALAGLLIPEKSDTKRMLRPGEEEEKPAAKNIFARAYDWARERPLRIPGLLWFGNNIMMAASAFQEYRNDPKGHSYKFKFGYVAAAVVANALMFISSKQGNKRFDIDSDSMQALFSVAAGVITAQPKEEQELLIEQVSGFISSQGSTPFSATEIANAIRSQADELSQNPFLPHSDVHAAQSHTSRHPLKNASSWQNLVQLAPESPFAGSQRV